MERAQVHVMAIAKGGEFFSRKARFQDRRIAMEVRRINFFINSEFFSGYFVYVFRTVLWGEENIGRMAGKES